MNEFKFKIKPGDSSEFNNDKLSKVTQSKIKYVVDFVEKSPPHIAFLGKNMLQWGGGEIFNKLGKTDARQIPFISTWDRKTKNYTQAHLDVKRPRDRDFADIQRRFGYTLEWPPPGLFDLFQSEFRKIWDNLITTDSPVFMAPCRGYIKANGERFDPAWYKHGEWSAQQVSGFLIWRTDERASINEFMAANKENEKIQILREQINQTIDTAPQLLDQSEAIGEARKQKAIVRREQILDSLFALKPKEDNEKIEKQ